MPAMKQTVAHQLGVSTAVERLKDFSAKLQANYDGQFKNLDEEWVENTLEFGFSTFGFNIKGSMEVTDDAVNVNGQIPFAAMMFKGKIEQEVRGALEKVLA